MARICLISLYEVNYMGTRCLASWLQMHGHKTLNIFFKDMNWTYHDTPVEEHRGYQYVQGGQLVRSGWDISPYSQTEVQLLRQAIADFTPDMVGLSARSPYDALAFDLISSFRQAAPSALLVAGGYGPTLRPEAYLQHGFDVVVRGDGEEALLELADNLTNRSFCRVVANTSWLDSQSSIPIHNPLRPQEKNIDKYPPPLHGDPYCSFIDKDTLYKQCDPLGASSVTFTTKAVYSTFISRGCTGRCTYCSGGQWADLYKKSGSRAYKCRIRDTHQVLKELKEIDKNIIIFGVNFLHV